MTTAATTLLGLALPVTGELSGTWGDTVNNSLTALLDTAVAGTTTLSTDADVTLTTTTLSANQARQAVILWTAGGTATRTITAPAQSKTYIVINKTSSTQSIKIVGVGPTTGVTIIAGEECLVAWNGVDFVKVASNSSFDAPVVIEGTTTSAALRITQLGTGNALLVEDAANPDSTPFVIDSGGKVLVGLTSSRTNNLSSGSLFQVEAVNSAATGAVLRNSADTGGAGLILGKSRGTAVGSFTAVVSGDRLGTLSFSGTDGTSVLSAATILSEVDGTPGTSDMPGRLVFSTTADGAATPTERMRIDSSGNVLIGTTTSPAGSNELVLGGDYIEGVVAIGNSSTTKTISLANGTFQTVTMTGNCTFTMPTAIAGKSFILICTQDATGSRTAVFTSVKWPGGTAPTLTTTATTGVDILTFVSNGTSWFGTYAQAFA